MKTICALFLSFSLISCSSSREALDAHPAAPAYSDNNANFCAGGIECVAIWILIYGSIATVRYIQEGVSNLTKFSDSNPHAVVLKCHVQTLQHDYVTPCGPFTVDIAEKITGKSTSYKLTGYDNQINLIKGKNRITVKVTECGLSQVADEVKVGDVIKLEFPPECRREIK